MSARKMRFIMLIFTAFAAYFSSHQPVFGQDQDAPKKFIVEVNDSPSIDFDYNTQILVLDGAFFSQRSKSSRLLIFDISSSAECLYQKVMSLNYREYVRKNGGEVLIDRYIYRVNTFKYDASSARAAELNLERKLFSPDESVIPLEDGGGKYSLQVMRQSDMGGSHVTLKYVDISTNNSNHVGRISWFLVLNNPDYAMTYKPRRNIKVHIQIVRPGDVINLPLVGKLKVKSFIPKTARHNGWIIFEPICKF